MKIRNWFLLALFAALLGLGVVLACAGGDDDDDGNGSAGDDDSEPTSGACCDDETCSFTTQADCGGTWLGPDVPCSPTDICANQEDYGACCEGNDCSVKTYADCTGAWQGANTNCAQNPCGDDDDNDDDVDDDVDDDIDDDVDDDVDDDADCNEPAGGECDPDYEEQYASTHPDYHITANPNCDEGATCRRSFTSISLDVPDSVEPGQPLTAAVNLHTCAAPNWSPSAVIYSSLHADWQMDSPIEHNDGYFIDANANYTESATVDAPTAIGTYRVRYMFCCAFDGVDAFCGDHDFGGVYDPGVCGYIEKTFKVCE